MNSDNNIWKIINLLGLKEENGRYNGTYATGMFDECYDYNYGLLYVSISFFPIKKNIYGVMFTISTADDGSWQAEDIKNDYTLDQAKNRVKEIAEHFINKMEEDYKFKLPTARMLNTWLMEKSMWGTFTG